MPVTPDRGPVPPCRLLQELATAAPPAFLCHYYNIYFAHTAGGRMIGAKVASMILDGAELAFYKVSKPPMQKGTHRLPSWWLNVDSSQVVPAHAAICGAHGVAVAPTWTPAETRLHQGYQLQGAGVS